jgi:hypothetical protein
MGRAFPRLVVLAAVACLAAGCTSGDGTTAGASGSAAATDSSAGSSTTAAQSAGPASTSSGAAVGPTAGPAGSFAANGSCALQHRGNLILWEKRPDTPATVKTVGDIDYATCQYAVDSLALTEPTDPGYCDILAKPSDNPGYDMKAASPPKPAHILTEAGNGC